VVCLYKKSVVNNRIFVYKSKRNTVLFYGCFLTSKWPYSRYLQLKTELWIESNYSWTIIYMCRYVMTHCCEIPDIKDWCYKPRGVICQIVCVSTNQGKLDASNHVWFSKPRDVGCKVSLFNLIGVRCQVSLFVNQWVLDGSFHLFKPMGVRCQVSLF